MFARSTITSIENLMNAMAMPFPLDWETYRRRTIEQAQAEDETLAVLALGMWCARYPYPCFHRSQVIGRIFQVGLFL